MSRSVEAPVAAGQHEATSPPRERRRPRVGEWVIAVVMLVFFVLAYVFSRDWPFRAALFPQMVAGVGFALSLVKILGLVVQTVRGRGSGTDAAIVPSTTAAVLPAQPQGSSPEAKQVRTAAVEGEQRGVTEPADGTAVTLVDDEAEEDESMEYVFATAGARAWIEAIAWITAFFVSFFVLGVFVTVPLFALLYLKFSGKASWVSALVYAAVTGVLIWLLFRQVIFIPLPTGYIPFLQL